MPVQQCQLGMVSSRQMVDSLAAACRCGSLTINRTQIVPSNPLKRDPTRTVTLRRMFEVELRRRIMIVARKIKELVVDEDAFGLKTPRGLTQIDPFANNQEQDDGQSTPPVAENRGSGGEGRISGDYPEETHERDTSEGGRRGDDRGEDGTKHMGGGAARGTENVQGEADRRFCPITNTQHEEKDDAKKDDQDDEQGRLSLVGESDVRLRGGDSDGSVNAGVGDLVTNEQEQDDGFSRKDKDTQKIPRLSAGGVDAQGLETAEGETGRGRLGGDAITSGGEDRGIDEGDGGDAEGRGQAVLHNRQTDRPGGEDGGENRSTAGESNQDGRENRSVVREGQSDEQLQALRCLTVNTRWAFQSDPQKVESFRRWISTQVEADILVAAGGDIDKAYWTSFVEEGYKKGAGRAFDDVRKPALASGQEQLDFFRGTKDEFLRQTFGRPVAIEKVKLLAGRVFNDLKGVTDEMSTKMTRALTQGLAQGQNPREIARAMIKDGIGFTKRRGVQSRALTIARTEIIRAHAEGQLDALENLGVEEVGVMVEWSTAGDDRVCPLCQPLESTVLKIKEARGILPRHPNCRCSFIPANVGESKTKPRRVEFTNPKTSKLETKLIAPKRGKAKVQAARDDSIRAEIPKSSKRTVARQKDFSKWPGADKRITKKRPRSVLEAPGVTRKVTPKKPQVTRVKPREVVPRFENRGDVSFSINDQVVVNRALKRAQNAVGNKSPKVERIITDPVLEERGILGTKSRDTIHFNERMTDVSKRKALEEEWEGAIIGNNSLEGLTTHEYGHIVNGAALNNSPKKYQARVWAYVNEETEVRSSVSGVKLKRWESDTLKNRSFYAAEDPSEWIAEAFADAVLHGEIAAQASKELLLRLKELL